MNDILKSEVVNTDCTFRLYRVKVPWGWLLIHVDDVLTTMPGIYLEQNHEWRTSITFIFDPFHWWKIKDK